MRLFGRKGRGRGPEHVKGRGPMKDPERTEHLKHIKMLEVELWKVRRKMEKGLTELQLINTFVIKDEVKFLVQFKNDSGCDLLKVLSLDEVNTKLLDLHKKEQEEEDGKPKGE